MRSSNLEYEIVHYHHDIKPPLHETNDTRFLFYSLLLGAECPLDGLQKNSLDKKSKDFLIKRLKRNILLLLYKVQNNEIICCCANRKLEKTGCLDETGFSGSLRFHMTCYTNVNFACTSQEKEAVVVPIRCIRET